MLGAIRGEQQGLGPRHRRIVPGVQQDLPQPRPEGGTAGLTGHDVLDPALAQPRREQPDLRRLTGAVASLEHDEPPGAGTWPDLSGDGIRGSIRGVGIERGRGRQRHTGQPRRGH